MPYTSYAALFRAWSTSTDRPGFERRMRNTLTHADGLIRQMEDKQDR